MPLYRQFLNSARRIPPRLLPLWKGLVVARGWSRSYVETRSRREKERPCSERSRRKVYSWNHAARPPKCGWLAEVHAIAEEPLACLYNPKASSQTKSQHRYSAKSGEGCRSNISGGRLGSLKGAAWPNVRQCTHGEIQKKNSMLCWRNRTDSYDEKRYRGAGIEEVQAQWKTYQDWMAQFKKQSVPFVYNFKALLKALSDKDTAAQSEVDAFMENSASRWQRRESTYQLERRRLPDAGDAPGYQGANIDMASEHGQRGELQLGGMWKLGLIGVDLLDDGSRECWPGVSLFCLFLERIDSHCVCFRREPV